MTGGRSPRRWPSWRCCPGCGSLSPPGRWPPATRYAPGGLLPALGVTARDDHNLIDLDSDTYFDLDGLRQFAAALLAQDGMDQPGPPGAAWTQYRARHAVRDRLAARDRGAGRAELPGRRDGRRPAVHRPHR